MIFVFCLFLFWSFFCVGMISVASPAFFFNHSLYILNFALCPRPPLHFIFLLVHFWYFSSSFVTIFLLLSSFSSSASPLPLLINFLLLSSSCIFIFLLSLSLSSPYFLPSNQFLPYLFLILHLPFPVFQQISSFFFLFHLPFSFLLLTSLFIFPLSLLLLLLFFPIV